jgi:hypothetical protein
MRDEERVNVRERTRKARKALDLNTPNREEPPFSKCLISLKSSDDGQSKETVMSLFAGLDISVKTTAICVLDANGRVLLETMVDSAPEVIAGRLHEFGQPFERIGLEAGPLSQ